MIPRATYRLQFRREFTFDDAQAIVPYLARLGISHVYASPILAARRGSPHGYDVVDHARLNPELGGEEAFRRFVARLHAHGLGLIVDVVPNHMATGPENRWWMDILEHGRASAHARYFDIDWDPPDQSLANKLLLPILACPFDEALLRGEISLVRFETTNNPEIAYYDHRLPLRPEDVDQIARDGIEKFRAPDALAELLDRQHYRLAWWRAAGDTINWRRFFDINDLIALRVEDDEVFDAIHAKPLALYAEGLIDGFRVDHLDGLGDPAAYCKKLRARIDSLKNLNDGRGYVIVEKILAPGEELPTGWGIDGTTGYDFMNDAGALLHEPAGAAPLSRLWTGISGRTGGFEEEERSARRDLLRVKFRGAFEDAARAFRTLYRPGTHDRTLASIERALARLLRELRIYRTYATGSADSWAPSPFFADAVKRALRRAPANDVAAMKHIQDVLEGHVEGNSELSRAAARHFNQLAASLAAKAGEDTAFYRFGRLLSRNEVGADPAEFAISPPEFHARALKRLGGASLLATATHDHKRGEDARARLAVLSEIPEKWAATAAAWFRNNTPLRDASLSAGDEYQLYQTLVGAWPLALDPKSTLALRAFTERMLGWRLKSLHEAKLRTSWGDPDKVFEDANAQFVRALLDPGRSPDFLSELSAFVDRIAPAAALNGLVQCVLRCTTPGVPDLYQGAEWWDFSMVDPDNRRPIDFAARAAALDVREEFARLLSHWRDGRVKQKVIAYLLALRAKHETCFREGDYQPRQAFGPRAGNLLYFVRTYAETTIAVIAPRLCARAAMEAKSPHPAPEFWADTEITIPGGMAWHSLFDEAYYSGHDFRCAELFARFPVAVLKNV